MFPLMRINSNSLSLGGKSIRDPGACPSPGGGYGNMGDWVGGCAYGRGTEMERGPLICAVFLHGRKV